MDTNEAPDGVEQSKQGGKHRRDGRGAEQREFQSVTVGWAHQNMEPYALVIDFAAYEEERDRAERNAEGWDACDRERSSALAETEAARAVLERGGYPTDSLAATVQTLIEEHKALVMRHAQQLGWNDSLEKTVAAVRKAVGPAPEPGDRS